MNAIIWHGTDTSRLVFFKSKAFQEHKLRYSKWKGLRYPNAPGFEQHSDEAFWEIISLEVSNVNGIVYFYPPNFQ